MGMISRPKKNLKVCSDADGDQSADSKILGTNQKRNGDSNDEADGVEWRGGIVTAAVPRENFC